MEKFEYITLRERPEIKDDAAKWFSSKWGVPKEAYLECMEDYLSEKTEYGWYLCLDDDKIVGGMGVIENDFHERKDLSPNVCAVFTEEDHRGRGIAGKLLFCAWCRAATPSRQECIFTDKGGFVLGFNGVGDYQGEKREICKYYFDC